MIYNNSPNWHTSPNYHIQSSLVFLPLQSALSQLVLANHRTM